MIDLKTVKEIEVMAREGRKRAENLGIKESDVVNIVHQARELRKKK